MEISEILSYYVYEENNSVEVSFKLTSDNDDQIRTDTININEFSEYGYSVINESIELDALDFDEDDYFDDYNFVDIDEYELVKFLNEYYIVNEDQLPKPKLI